MDEVERIVRSPPKLRIDFRAGGPLGAAMASRPPDAERHDLVRRLFATLTARMEDGAALAVQGQHPDATGQEQRSLADSLTSIADEIALLTAVIPYVIEPPAAA